MSDKLPVVSGRDVVKTLTKMGYIVVRQRGSHLRLEHQKDRQKKKITVPDHKVLGKGLLCKILRDAELSVDEFIRTMKS